MYQVGDQTIGFNSSAIGKAGGASASGTSGKGEPTGAAEAENVDKDGENKGAHTRKISFLNRGLQLSRHERSKTAKTLISSSTT